ncbi:hypothetical protein LFM09_38900 [Lentzea alba]
MTDDSSSRAVDGVFSNVLIQDAIAIVALGGEIDMTTDEMLLAEAETS